MPTTSTTPQLVPDATDLNVYLEEQTWEDSDTAGVDVVLDDNNAVATMRIYERDGATQVAGPISLESLDATTGQWRGRIPATTTLVVGSVYKIVVTIVANSGPTRTYVVWIRIGETDG